MAVYLHIFNLIIKRQTVIDKYAGGVDQFRIDYDLPHSEINQEDDELFSLGQMDVDEFDFDRLIAKGLNYDEAQQSSDDFIVLYRYDDLPWELNWIAHNQVFAWHVDTSPDIILKVEEISNMSIDALSEQMKQGNNLFKAIRNGKA